MHNLFTAIKVAHIRWDEAKIRFSPAKTTHVFNLFLVIGLALTVTFIMIYKLVWAMKNLDIYFLIVLVAETTSTFMCSVVIFRRNALLLFLNWYASIHQSVIQKGI